VDEPPQATGEEIWTRAIDHARHRRRMARAVRFYVVPAVLVTLATAILAGPAEGAGAAIVLALAGVLVVGIPWMHNRIERAGAAITLEGGTLRCGRTTVALPDVESFTTFRTAHGATGTARPPGGVARFRRLGAKDVEFYWAGMPDAEIDDVRAALEGVLPGMWRPREA